MSLREQVRLDLDKMPEADIRQVADYVAFLKYRSRRIRIPMADEVSLARLYGEFAEEDLELADAGLDDYSRALAREDQL